QFRGYLFNENGHHFQSRGKVAPLTGVEVNAIGNRRESPHDVPLENFLISRTGSSQVIVTVALRYVRCAAFFPTVGVVSAG
ncbi:hypothetical protein, partial [Corynebacterium hylobatis]|uniref:hypothetical protein n=1 Tax=Corynebacterium hylobatis TaxID=1859290 RepID=UPI0019D14F23